MWAAVSFSALSLSLAVDPLIFTARTFPETMPTKWYAEIYDIRFKIYNVLQRRKRQGHEATWSREAFHDFHPHDLEHDGNLEILRSF